MKLNVYISEILYDLKLDIHKFLFKRKISENQRKEYEINKWYTYAQIMFQWNWLKQFNRGIAEYLKEEGYKKIAIYGCGEVGKLCCDELLRDQEIDVVAMIDKWATESYKQIPILRPQAIRERIDVIIITPAHCYLEIAEELCKYTNAKFISIEDIVTILKER